jgi:hypothetical protein
MKLTGQVVRLNDITDVEREEMFLLLETYYANVDRSSFQSDLDEKHWVILLKDPLLGVVRGFSTQMLLHVEVGTRMVRALFSGDTIVRREYWARNPLAHVWGNFALALIDEHRAGPLVWFLTTKGYKTYRFLPLFFHEFYPRHDQITPTREAEMIDALARHKYPTGYDAASGVLRWGDSGCRLREGVAEVDHGRMRDPHIRYFTQLNPGHERGDELCCIAPLTRENFTPAAYRVIGAKAAAARVP